MRIPLDQVVFDQVSEYQCSGCVAGSDPDCGHAKIVEELGMFHCVNHCPGTSLGPYRIALGLPKGFNRVGFHKFENENPMIRIWRDGHVPEWNNLNVPVWKMVVDGVLYVRTFLPRLNIGLVDVIPGGSIDVCDGKDVSEFINDID